MRLEKSKLKLSSRKQAIAKASSVKQKNSSRLREDQKSERVKKSKRGQKPKRSFSKTPVGLEKASNARKHWKDEAERTGVYVSIRTDRADKAVRSFLQSVKVKLERACGGCLGALGRRRTW